MKILLPAAHPPLFQPRRFFTSGHVQTIAGNYLPRVDHLPPPEQVLVESVAAAGDTIATQLLCLCNWQPESVRAARPTVILLHGLEGSANSQYVVGNGNKFWAAGANVIRMNMRNCGGTERLSPTLYHSGYASDVIAVLRHFITAHGLESIAIIGYSMGGNLVLRAAGDLGPDAPPQLHSVVGISPAVDMALSSDTLHAPRNRIYEWKFVRSLIARYLRKCALFPQSFNPARARGIRSLRDFDERIVAHYYGFRNADDYYHSVSALRTIDRIAVPTFILHAEDDPFIIISAEARRHIQSNPNINYVEVSHGGHCAFLADPAPGYDGYWAEYEVLRFVLQHAGGTE